MLRAACEAWSNAAAWRDVLTSRTDMTLCGWDRAIYSRDRIARTTGDIIGIQGIVSSAQEAGELVNPVQGPCSLRPVSVCCCWRPERVHPQRALNGASTVLGRAITQAEDVSGLEASLGWAVG